MAIVKDDFPKILNDGKCHAVLKDGSRCPNDTSVKLWIEGNPVYEKWCPRHKSNCVHLNQQYKNSCSGFKNWNCTRRGQLLFESGKLTRLNTCIEDRIIFEGSCLHTSKRDQGHSDFMDNLNRQRNNCREIVNLLQRQRPVLSSSIARTQPSEEEKTIQDLDNLILEINILPKSQILPKKQTQPIPVPKKKKARPKKIVKPDEDISFLEPLIKEIQKQTVEDHLLKNFKLTEQEIEQLKKSKFQELINKYNIDYKSLTKREKLKVDFNFRELFKLEVEKETNRRILEIMKKQDVERIDFIEKNLISIMDKLNPLTITEEDEEYAKSLFDEVFEEIKKVRKKVNQSDDFSIEIHDQIKNLVSMYSVNLIEKILALVEDMKRKAEFITGTIILSDEEDFV
jgi:hypothetical protein